MTTTGMAPCSLELSLLVAHVRCVLSTNLGEAISPEAAAAIVPSCYYLAGAAAGAGRSEVGVGWGGIGVADNNGMVAVVGDHACLVPGSGP